MRFLVLDFPCLHLGTPSNSLISCRPRKITRLAFPYRTVMAMVDLSMRGNSNALATFSIIPVLTVLYRP